MKVFLSMKNIYKREVFHTKDSKKFEILLVTCLTILVVKKKLVLSYWFSFTFRN